jgi:hypothetical protein
MAELTLDRTVAARPSISVLLSRPSKTSTLRSASDDGIGTGFGGGNGLRLGCWLPGIDGRRDDGLSCRENAGTGLRRDPADELTSHLFLLYSAAHGRPGGVCSRGSGGSGLDTGRILCDSSAFRRARHR